MGTPPGNSGWRLDFKRASLKAGDMEHKEPRAPRVKGKVKVVSSIGYSPENASTGYGFDAAGDLVRIVSRLTQDIELFDSMIRDQRHQLLQQGGDLAALDDERLRRQTKRISVRAAEIATRAQGALDELRGLSFSGEPDASED
jgi:hypothetical protein